MRIKELQEFEKVRKKLRAYLCYLLKRNIPNRLDNLEVEIVIEGLTRIVNELPEVQVAYILDPKGHQIGELITLHDIHTYIEESQANRTHFYKAVKERKCILTDPYPSLINGELVVSAAAPIFDSKGKLLYVAVIEIPLKKALKIFHEERGDRVVIAFNKIIYSLFAAALFIIVIFLFTDGVKLFIKYSLKGIEVKKIFEATILITLSLAIFDLVKTLVMEEVVGEKEEHPFEIHKTMIKFLGSIIIALAIEGLMLVFKFAMISPDKIIYASILLTAVTFLIIGLAFYMKWIGKDLKI
jgi:hypothetical protein